MLGGNVCREPGPRRTQYHQKLVGPPPLTLMQRVLILAGVCVALVGYFCPKQAILQAIALIELGLNISFCSSTAWESLWTRSPGKFILAFAMLTFFWIDAAFMALADPPFAVPAGMPLGGPGFPVDLVQGGLFRVAVFQCLLFAGYSLRPKARGIVYWLRGRVDKEQSWVWRCRYAMALASLAPLVVGTGGKPEAVVSTLLAARSGSQMEWRDPGLVAYISTVGFFGVGLVAVEAFSGRPLKTQLALLAGIASTPYVFGGARHHVLNVILPVLLWQLACRRGGALTKAAGLTAASGGLLGLFTLQMVFRSVGWRATSSVTSLDLPILNMTGMFSALLFALYLVPGTVGYFFDIPEVYFLIHWIPRAYWSDKPVMPSWEYFNGAWTQGAAFNVTPSVIGQYHLNFGFAGIVYIGLVLGLLTSVVDRVVLNSQLRRQKALITFLGLAYAFIVSSFRYYAPLYFALAAFGFAGMLCLTERLPERAKKRSPIRRFA